MCLFGIIKLLRKTFHKKSQNSNQECILVPLINITNYQIINIEKIDNFNPNATHVNNSHYYERPEDEESEEEQEEESKDEP